MRKLIKVGKYFDEGLSSTLEFYINPNTPDSCVNFPTKDKVNIKIELGYSSDFTWVDIFDNIQHELEELYYRADKKVYTYLDNPSEGTTSLMFIFNHDAFQENRIRASKAYCAIENNLRDCFNKLKKVKK